MTENKHTQPENTQETAGASLGEHLADLNETMQREKIPLSPEMKAYLRKSVEAVQTKLMNREPIYPKDMEFVEKIKTWMAMPARHRKQLTSIELMEHPRVSKEEKERLLGKLKERFEKNMYLHEGLEWVKVKESLEPNEEAVWSINEMEVAGHEPDVYNADKEGFDVGTCSKQSPKSGMDCVYDAEAAEKLRKENPGKKFNGNAVEMAKAMKIELMSKEQYKDILQTKGSFDTESWIWLKTPADTRKSGDALCGDRNTGDVSVFQLSADFHDDNLGWRGSLRVLWS